MKEKPDVGPPYFGVFPSDHILNDEGCQRTFLLSCSSSCKLYQQIRETFLSCYIYVTQYTPEADVIIIPY